MSTLSLQRPSLFSLAPSLGLARAQPQQPNKPRLRSEDLFRNGCELIIEHRGEEYRLKLTRNDKLILNK
ncbi:MAG: hemin uptake protein HemP [Stagnimonas sp.]|nr:hemin uptake protein HemP [Stagnimonas sp.]